MISMQGTHSSNKLPTPRVVAWEVTRACPLACIHCRAEAQKTADPRQLTTEEGLALLENIASMGGPTVVILTGGEPLTRAGSLRTGRVRHATRPAHGHVARRRAFAHAGNHRPAQGIWAYSGSPSAFTTLTRRRTTSSRGHRAPSRRRCRGWRTCGLAGCRSRSIPPSPAGTPDRLPQNVRPGPQPGASHLGSLLPDPHRPSPDDAVGRDATRAVRADAQLAVRPPGEPRPSR